MGRRIFSHEASDKPQSPASTQGRGVGGTGWPWHVGWGEGTETAAWQEAVPMQGQFSVRTTWVSEPVGRQGQAGCSLTSFREVRPPCFLEKSTGRPLTFLFQFGYL